MIVVEKILQEIFSQLPPVIRGSKSFDIKFEWGNEKDLVLYLKEAKIKYPLIWLVESKENHFISSNSVEKNLRLIIAKDSQHVTNRNPTVWNTEFDEVLNPILENVITAFKKSGVTTILNNNSYEVEKRANYTENEKAKAIDFWNVIILDIKIRFEEKANGQPKCINTIKF